jgi:RNA polymerase sigma-70 factor, ECF subfamily
MESVIIHGTAPTSITKGVVLMNTSEQNRRPSTEDSGKGKQSDALLVIAACSGNPHAFAELSRLHSKRVLLRLHRITKNWQDAEDVLQEALMKAFLHLDSFQGKASFSTWFTSIAVNTAFMLLRKRRGVLEIAINNASEKGTYSEWDLKDSRDNPEQCFERRQRLDLIRSGILKLPPELRKAVALQHSKDLSNKEIARCLGISLGATKSRLLRARMALRVLVQSEASQLPTRAAPVSAKRPTVLKSRDNDINIHFQDGSIVDHTKLSRAPRLIGNSLD